MAPTKGVPVQLDKARVLRYDNRAFCRLEEETDKTFVEHFEEVRRRSSLLSVSALVWAGLVHNNPDLTREEVQEMIDLARMEEIVEAAGEAIALARGEEPEANPAAKKKKTSAKKKS